METSTLTDAQWEKLRPLLPPQQSRTGPPANDRRTVLDGILWVLRTRSPWRAVPAHFGSWKTVSSRFYPWTRVAVWDRVLAELQRQADREGRLDWTLADEAPDPTFDWAAYRERNVVERLINRLKR